MTTTRRGYVFGTFLSSCAALVLLIVACATNVWINSRLTRSGDLSDLQSNANYGLFRGSFDKTVFQANTYTLDITLVCDLGENICAWSCLDNSEGRKSELKYLLGGGTTDCTANSYFSPVGQSSFRRNVTSSAGTIRKDELKAKFMNAGLYVSTVIVLMLALLATTAATLLAVINAASNPSRTWLAVESLYFWNGAAAGLDLLCLILWGTHYAIVLKDSIALSEVICGNFVSEDLAQLGWSYWLVLVALLISAANVGVLAWRDYLIHKEPPPPTWNPEKEAADGTLILY